MGFVCSLAKPRVRGLPVCRSPAPLRSWSAASTTSVGALVPDLSFKVFPGLELFRPCPVWRRFPAWGVVGEMGCRLAGECRVPVGLPGCYRAYRLFTISYASLAALALSWSWTSRVVIRVAINHRPMIPE